MRDTISIATLFALARILKSEYGENKEYDRALVELCTDAAGVSMEERDKIASELEILQ